MSFRLIRWKNISQFILFCAIVIPLSLVLTDWVLVLGTHFTLADSSLSLSCVLLTRTCSDSCKLQDACL